MSDHAHHASGPTSAAAGTHAHAEHHDEHIHSVEHYVKIWIALLVLFLISVTGPMIGIKWLTLITAFGIAVVKASMVVHYFMHLTVEKRFVHYFLATSVVFMFLFFAAVAPDVMKHEGTRWVNVAAIAAKERAEAEHAAAGGHGEHGGEAPAHEAAPAEGGGGGH
ncbi:MAG: cytochrome C oxidase subunit IV family protein [Myxococcota bacterium]